MNRKFEKENCKGKVFSQKEMSGIEILNLEKNDHGPYAVVRKKTNNVI